MTDVRTLPTMPAGNLPTSFLYGWTPGTPDAQFKVAVSDLQDELSYTDADARKAVQEWAPNFTADGNVYIPARVAMTIAQGNAKIGTGTLTFEKSTAAAPGTFASTALPAVLEAGAWLKVIATGVTGFVATHLVRSA